MGGYPVTLLVAGHRCLVVGGGAVAARKVAGLTDCGAQVTVVAPRLHQRIEERACPKSGPGSVVLARRPYRSGEAAGYRLVVAATGRPGVDREVARDATAAGVWVNCADDPQACSFLAPSVHRQGPLSVSVSSGGTSPALAAWLRRRLAEVVGPEFATVARMLQEARQQLQSSGRSTASVDWSVLLDGPLCALVASGQLRQAHDILHQHLGLARAPSTRNGPAPGSPRDEGT